MLPAKATFLRSPGLLCRNRLFVNPLLDGECGGTNCAPHYSNRTNDVDSHRPHGRMFRKSTKSWVAEESMNPYN